MRKTGAPAFNGFLHRNPFYVQAQLYSYTDPAPQTSKVSSVDLYSTEMPMRSNVKVLGTPGRSADYARYVSIADDGEDLYSTVDVKGVRNSDCGYVDLLRDSATPNDVADVYGFTDTNAVPVPSDAAYFNVAETYGFSDSDVLAIQSDEYFVPNNSEALKSRNHPYTPGEADPGDYCEMGDPDYF